MERLTASQAAARRRGGLPRMYVAAWVALSSMAITYLAMYSVRPDLAESLGRQIASLSGAPSKSPEAARAADERVRADLAELRRGLDTLQREMTAVRTVIAAREERDQAFAARLAAMEAQKPTDQALPLSTSSISPTPTDTRTRADDDTPPPRTARGRSAEEPREDDDAAAATRREKAKDGDRVAVGTPQAKAPPPAEPSGPRGIQIATGPSVDALRISWMLLSERHKEILRRYEPRFVPSTGGSGPAYRLIAGPIENATAASKVCSELRARRVTCGVSAFGGEPL